MSALWSEKSPRPCVTCKEPTSNDRRLCDLCRAIGVPDREAPDPHDHANQEALAERYER